MKSETKEKQDYIKAFNQGYELSKELGLKPEILRDLSAGNNRMQAMKEGMEQYGREISKEKNMEVIPPFNLDSLDNTLNIDLSSENKDKGMDIDI